MTAGIPRISEHSLVTTMENMCRTEMWDVNPNTSRPGTASRKGENGIEVPATDGNIEFVMKIKDVRPTNIEK